jgi:hypothetical protein
MDKEITITIKREDLQALYRAYLMECYGGLEVQCVEMQKEMAEQKDRIEKIVNEALEADGNK